jgi:hypothetical protein
MTIRERQATRDQATRQTEISHSQFQIQTLSPELRQHPKIGMTFFSLSTPFMKTGSVPKLLARLGRDKSEGAGC